jgi:tRNA nucleotidyltransferase (CCA-adding enzyme)
MHDLGKGTTPKDILPRHLGHEERGVDLVKTLCRRIKVPNDCRDLAVIAARFHGKAHRAVEMRPDTIMRMLQDTDALRQPQRFEDFLLACECDARGRTGFESRAYPQANRLRLALRAAQAVDAGAVAARQSTPDAIRDAVYQARLVAVERALLQA